MTEKMKVFQRWVPDGLTLLNLLSGFFALVFVFKGQLQVAFGYVILAAVFDFLDGFMARILDVSSKRGEILDSLADMVSFGIVPSAVGYQLLASANMPGISDIAMIAIGSLIALFACLRLAKFHFQAGADDFFRGLPTPANALLFVSLGYVSQMTEPYGAFQLFRAGFLIPLIGIFSVLMIANLRMLNLKFKTFSWHSNKFRYIFLFLALCLLGIGGIPALPPLIVFYVAYSIVFVR